MADFPALPLWTDSYLADTRHLKRDQHGAYLLLLMEAWRRTDCSLPDDDDVLATLACASAEEWQRLKPVVMAFWKLDGRAKVWRQKRLSSERSFVERKRAQNRDKALDRWKRTKNPDAVAMPNGMPNGCQTDAPTPTPSTTPTNVGVNAQKRGHRLSKDWVLPLDDEAFALEAGMTRERVARTSTRFKNHWLAKTGADATKLDWSRTWQNWVLSDLERDKRGPPQKPKNGSAKLSDLLAQPFEDTFGHGRNNGENPAPTPLRQLPDQRR